MTQPEQPWIRIYTSDGRYQVHEFPASTPEQRKEGILSVLATLEQTSENPNGTLTLQSPFKTYALKEITNVEWLDGNGEWQSLTPNLPS